MNDEGRLFILAGNGPYQNRGCEAIVRGTVKILRKYFRNPRFVCLSHFRNEQQYRDQCLQESDDAIVHLSSSLISNKRTALRNFWKPEIWRYAYNHFFKPDALKYQVYENMLSYLDEASVVLTMGGDTYSLSYGIPYVYTDLADIVLEKKKPIVLWGASVGPFDALPEYERYMIGHLKKVTGIFARESVTIEYLKSIGVSENVYPVADPAFLLDPTKPVDIDETIPIEGGSIGINLSPLLGKYVIGGDMDAWIRLCARTIESISSRTGRPIYLIPHDTLGGKNMGYNDYLFLRAVMSNMSEKRRGLNLISPHLDAAETKYVISKMAFLIAARTHAAIAALSSCVPTLSLSYSTKAKGINRDVLGHESYCLDLNSISPGNITKKSISMLEESDTIKEILKKRIPYIQDNAFAAGKHLFKLLDDS